MNKHELAEQYAAKWVNKSLNKLVGVSDEYTLNQKRVVQIDFLAGFNTCLTELAKQGGEYREFWIDLETKEKHTEYKDISNYFATDSDHVGYTHVIDIAALHQANAKNAYLKECDLNQLKEISELQQRVKELSDALSTQRDLNTTAFTKLQEAEKVISEYQTRCIDAAIKIGLGFNNGAIDQLQIAQDKAENYLQNKGDEVKLGQEFYGTNKLNEKLIELAGEKESLRPISPVIFNPNTELQTKLTALESQLKEAEKLKPTKREFEALDAILDSVQEHMSHIEDKNSPYVKDCFHVDKFIKRARTYLQNKGG